MTTTASALRTRLMADLARASENHALAYERGDSTNVAFWADQRDRYSRLLDKANAR